MSNFSDWSETAWVDGTSPYINAANLNKNEDALTKVMDELSYSKHWSLSSILQNLYNNNCNSLLNYDDYTDWSTSGTVTLSNDVSNGLFGMAACKVLETDNSSGLITVYDTLSYTTDFTKFHSGRASVSYDYVLFEFYVSDVTYFSEVKIRLGTDSSNYYYFTLASGSLVTGWNFPLLRKDYFNSTGSPDWSTINYVSHHITTLANAQNQYILLDQVLLVPRDDSRVLSNPWFFDDGSGNFDEEIYVSNTIQSVIYFDNKVNKLGFQLLNETASTAFVETLCTVNSFSTKIEAYSKADTYGCAVMWYIDSSNYLIVSVEGDELVIYEYVSGSGSDVVAVAVDTTIEHGDRMELYVDKIGDIIRAELRIDGQKYYYAAWETSFDADEAGCVGLVKPNTGQEYFVSDFVVGHSQAHLPLFNAQKTLYKVKNYAQEVASSTTLVDDDELFIKLPPNGIFEIKTMIHVNCASSTPDIKISWSLTGSAELFGRLTSMGNYTNVSTMIETDSFRWISYPNTTSINFGHDGTSSRNNPVQQIFLVQTKESGGMITMQWAQNTSNATAIKILASSYITAEKIR